MATPPRHGLRWNRAPTPTPDGASGVAVLGSLTRLPDAAPQVGIIPVREVDSWLRSLPSESISFFSVGEEVRYDHNLGTNGSVVMNLLTVPSQYVWVITDAEFYALGPSTKLMGSPKNLDAEALIGILRLEMQFSGSAPMNTAAHRMSPYQEPGQATATTSGWPWLQHQFGSQRVWAFALYAKESQSVSALVTVEQVPRFPISKLGMNLHGFAVPSQVFSRAWVV